MTAVFPDSLLSLAEIKCTESLIAAAVVVRMFSTVHEEPVLASVHKPTLPSINELLDSTFSILDDDNQHRFITPCAYTHALLN